MDQNPKAPGATENDILDDMDCRPENAYPEANREAATPDYIREMLAGKKSAPVAEPEPDKPAEPENKNPA